MKSKHLRYPTKILQKQNTNQRHSSESWLERYNVWRWNVKTIDTSRQDDDSVNSFAMICDTLARAFAADKGSNKPGKYFTDAVVAADNCQALK